jgi:hypothetical protein
MSEINANKARATAGVPARGFVSVGNRCRSRATVAAVQVPLPLDVGTLSSFSDSAILRSDAVRSGYRRAMTNAIERAWPIALRVRVVLALAASPQSPPASESVQPHSTYFASGEGGLCPSGEHAGFQLGHGHPAPQGESDSWDPQSEGGRRNRTYTPAATSGQGRNGPADRQRPKVRKRTYPAPS